jgi:hypothetical protein
VCNRAACLAANETGKWRHIRCVVLQVRNHLEMRVGSSRPLLHALHVVLCVGSCEEGVLAWKLTVATVSGVLHHVDVGAVASEAHLVSEENNVFAVSDVKRAEDSGAQAWCLSRC